MILVWRWDVSILAGQNFFRAVLIWRYWIWRDTGWKLLKKWRSLWRRTVPPTCQQGQQNETFLVQLSTVQQWKSVVGSCVLVYVRGYVSLWVVGVFICHYGNLYDCEPAAHRFFSSFSPLYGNLYVADAVVQREHDCMQVSFNKTWWIVLPFLRPLHCTVLFFGLFLPTHLGLQEEWRSDSAGEGNPETAQRNAQRNPYVRYRYQTLWVIRDWC